MKRLDDSFSHGFRKRFAEEALDPALCRDYVGGYGLGARLLFSHMQPGADALGPGNIFGLVTGPFTLALHLMGTGIFLKMFDAVDEVRRVLDFCTEVATQAADFYLDNGADATIGVLIDTLTAAGIVVTRVAPCSRAVSRTYRRIAGPSAIALDSFHGRNE